MQAFVEGYTPARAKVQPCQFMPAGYTDQGYRKVTEEDAKEIQLDILEGMATYEHSEKTIQEIMAEREANSRTFGSNLEKEIVSNRVNGGDGSAPSSGEG